MLSIFVLLMLFLCVGLFAHQYDTRVRFLLITFIIIMMIYINMAGGG